ncbi:MAG: tRNA threonylcarbamoyladenosine dehydratase [Campylobacter sp.]|nr:tRNA threonylcarbamoyladenosine dehydratase [Campylobacter sp.]
MQSGDRFSRIKSLLGDDFSLLQKAKILVCGAGGVGGICADTLARSGVGEIVLIDCDSFEITNQNRQLYSEACGVAKVEEFASRYENIKGINEKISEEFLNDFDISRFDLVIDAIDDMRAKILLALKSPKLIASMGSAKRLDATQVKVDSVWRCSGDPFARKYRYELRKAGFSGDFDVVFSSETPRCKELGSFMGVTAVFGLNLASLAVRKILKS